MKNAAESKALEQLYSTATLGRIFEHRHLFESSIQPGTDAEYPLAVAMELSQGCYIVFTVSQGELAPGQQPPKIFEFVTFCDNRDKAIEAVFSLIPK